MHDPAHVFGPECAARILRSGNDEFSVRQTTRRLAQKLLDFWLPIRSIRPHVAKIAHEPAVCGPAAILLRIERAVKRYCLFRPEMLLQLLKHGTAGKAEIKIEAGHLTTQQILRI